MIKHRYRCDVCGCVVLINDGQRLRYRSCSAVCPGELQLISGPPPAQADRSPSPAPQTRSQHY